LKVDNSFLIILSFDNLGGLFDKNFLLKGPYLLISKEMLGLCMDEDVKKFPLKKKKRKGRKK